MKCNNYLLAVPVACRGLWCVIKEWESIKVLWHHSYLVWLLFGDSIPIIMSLHFLKRFL